MDPFDPLDPDHRAERGRERTAFFRQTNLFPVVVLTMVTFVPLALWQARLALPFLGWMAFMPHIVGGVDRMVANTFSRTALFRGSAILSAIACIAVFLVVGLLLPAKVLLALGAILALIYAYGLITGRLFLQGDIQ